MPLKLYKKNLCWFKSNKVTIDLLFDLLINLCCERIARHSSLPPYWPQSTPLSPPLNGGGGIPPTEKLKQRSCLWSQNWLLTRQNLVCCSNTTNPAQQALTNDSRIANPSFPSLPHPLSSKLRRPVSCEGNIIHIQTGPDNSIIMVGIAKCG